LADLKNLGVERVREFGTVFLALALWRRLGLHELLAELIEPGGRVPKIVEEPGGMIS
jgi:hypothetical protein